MTGEVPDRVPLMCQMSIGHMLIQTGASPAAFWNSAEIYGEGLNTLRRAYSFDGILVSLHGHSPDWERSVARLEDGKDSEVVVWKSGDRTVFPRDDLPIHLPRESPVPLSLADLNPESLPEDIRYIPVSQGLRFAIDPDHRFDVIDALVRTSGREFSVHGEVTSPFDYYLDLFGFEQGFLGLVDFPDKARDVLERFARGVEKLAAEMAGRGVDAIKVSSPYAGARFISPAFYREFVLPVERWIAAAVRRRGVPVYVHTCGAIHDRLEMMVEAGFSGIECLDPPPLGTVELEEAKRRIGGSVFIKGNIDPVNTLLKGNVQAVGEDARARLRIGLPGGRFILSSACSIAPYTPRENIEVLIQVVEEAGSYGSVLPAN